MLILASTAFRRIAAADNQKGSASRDIAAYLLCLRQEGPRAQALEQTGVDVLARHEAGAIGVQPLLVGPNVAHGDVCQLPPAGNMLGRWELWLKRRGWAEEVRQSRRGYQVPCLL